MWSKGECSVRDASPCQRPIDSSTRPDSALDRDLRPRLSQVLAAEAEIAQAIAKGLSEVCGLTLKFRRLWRSR